MISFLATDFLALDLRIIESILPRRNPVQIDHLPANPHMPSNASQRAPTSTTRLRFRFQTEFLLTTANPISLHQTTARWRYSKAPVMNGSSGPSGMIDQTSKAKEVRKSSAVKVINHPFGKTQEKTSLTSDWDPDSVET